MTVYDSKLTSFLGQGPAASQPATLNLHPSVFGLYHAKDTGMTNLWDGTTWTPLGGGGGTAGVSSFNTRTGAVTLTSTDVTTALTFTPYSAANPSGYQTAAQVTAALGPYALITSIPVGSSATPLMDGVAAAGSGTKFSKDDHIHPVDTSRYAASNPSGYQTAAQVSASITASAYTLPTASTSVLGGVKVDGTTVTIASGVISAVAGGSAGVTSFNTRTGAVTLTSADVTTALTFTPYNATNPSGYQTAAQVTTALVPYAPIKDAVFTGTTTLPGAPTVDLHASTKLYVDQSVATVASAGITTLSYNVIANTTAADPGTGNIRFNTTQQYDATQIYIDSRAIDNTDWTLFMKAQATGSKIVIQLKTDSTKVCRFLTTGAVTDNTGWLTIPVTQTGAGGFSGMPFAGGNNVVVAFLGTTNNQFLPLGGGTLTGDLFLPSTTPTLATQATTKKYVDDTAAVETYTLPTASTSVLGGVKVDGSTITIAAGVISAVAGGAGTVTKVATSGTGISGGPITTAGTLTVAWNAGAVSSLGSSLSLTTGVLDAVVPVGSSALPVINGTAAAGVGTKWSKDDHVHPTDTTRYAATNPSGYQTSANVVTALAAGNPGAFSTLSASSTVSGTGFSTYLASPPAIGGTAAAAGSFTTLSASGVVSGAGFTTLLSGYALTSAVPVGSSATPVMDGVAAAGSGTKFSKDDHVHPTDTSRYAAANPSGYQTSAQVSSAITAAAYVLPTASTSVLGGVKVDGTTVVIAAGVISAAGAGVTTFNTRAGAVTLTSADVTTALTFTPYNSTNPSGYQTAANVVTALAAGNPGAFSTLSASSTVSGTGFSTYLASPPAIGGTAAAAGSFTTLTASSTVSGAGFTTLLSPYALTSAIPAASSTTPLVASGAGAVGVGTTYARADHAHPVGGAQPYTVGVYVPGVLTASQVVVTHQVGIAVTFPAAFGATATGGSSRCGSLVNATASTTLTVAKCLAANDPTNTANFSAIGTLVFGAGGHAGTLATTGGTAQALAAGDFLRVIGPSSADATLANLFITLIADR